MNDVPILRNSDQNLWIISENINSEFEKRIDLFEQLRQLCPNYVEESDDENINLEMDKFVKSSEFKIYFNMEELA